ncbi:MAG: GDP-mannose 4,6-dehydratase [Thermoleophilaceae bacterium]
MSARRALITGIAGQDGSYLAELLLDKGYEVFGIVRGSPAGAYPNLAAVREHVHLLQGDLLDQMTLLDAITQSKPDELYNRVDVAGLDVDEHFVVDPEFVRPPRSGAVGRRSLRRASSWAGSRAPASRR